MRRWTMKGKICRKAIRKDVLDELTFIIGANQHYTVAQREHARKLLHALDGTDWKPEEEIQKVVDILDGHNIDIPKYLSLRR